LDNFTRETEMSHRWKVKCANDAVKACLPCQRHLRRLKDSVLGYKREPGKDTNTIRDGLTMIEWLGNIAGARVLEIGTGWQPMIPILLSLAGAKVYMADLYRLMRQDTFRAALDAIRENRDEIVARIRITRDEVDHATRECHDMEERLRDLKLEYLAPCDCRHLALRAGSIDVVTSRAVLEHVPPGVITDIFQEAKRILCCGGRMLHLIDHSDHWSHRDPGISAVNFLQYPDWLFRLTYINPQNYQNRLRHSEYLAMLKSTGFLLKREQGTVNSTCAAALSELQIDAQFRRFETTDLATTRSILLANS
jgi:cyclopropane fatty-acyl-phospholipid synthase-like methyltransferase